MRLANIVVAAWALASLAAIGAAQGAGIHYHGVASFTKRVPHLRSSYAYVVDQQNGLTLYAKKPEVRTPIASITKLMTAMVVLDAHLRLGKKITIAAVDKDRVKNTVSRLRIGTRLSRQELLQLALMSSENRAAAALAHSYPAGYAAFIAAMNRKARQLSMTHTHFVDPTGLHSANQSTAEDLAKMVKAAYRYPLIRRITTTRHYTVETKRAALPYRNTNILVRNHRWKIGLSKTGFINEAGHCLVMQARIAHRPIIIVLLDSVGKYSRIGDANRIKHWIEHNEPAFTAALRRRIAANNS